MTEQRNKLIASLEESFEGTPWLGVSLFVQLQKVDIALVNNLVGNSQNSIAVLVQHIINWRIFVIEKIKGNVTFDIELNSKADWTKITIQNISEWNTLLQNLKESQEEIIFLLKQKDETFLEEIVSGRSYTFQYLLEGIIQHDIYHSGQIGLLCAQLRKRV